jgi:hypothetical protein
VHPSCHPSRNARQRYSLIRSYTARCVSRIRNTRGSWHGLTLAFRGALLAARPSGTRCWAMAGERVQAFETARRELNGARGVHRRLCAHGQTSAIRSTRTGAGKPGLDGSNGRKKKEVHGFWHATAMLCHDQQARTVHSRN